MEKKKTIIIGALLCAIILMSVGYAYLAQELTVTAKATITDTQWNVKIVGIEKTDEGTTSDADETLESIVATTGATSVSFHAKLAYPGDFSEYTVTFKNLGTIPAKLDSITPSTFADINGQEVSDLQFSMEGDLATVGATLDAGASKTVTIRAEWINDPLNPQEISDTESENTKTQDIVFTFVQNTTN